MFFCVTADLTVDDSDWKTLGSHSASSCSCSTTDAVTRTNNLASKCMDESKCLVVGYFASCCCLFLSLDLAEILNRQLWNEHSFVNCPFANYIDRMQSDEMKLWAWSFLHFLFFGHFPLSNLFQECLYRFFSSSPCYIHHNIWIFLYQF